MKKAGIFTFHNAHNYGAVLQAFALKTKLESFGLETSVINYGKTGFTKRFDFDFKGIKPFLASLYINVLSLLNADLRRFRFKNFRQKFLNISKNNYVLKSQLSSISTEFDYMITGSDQVWNFNLTNNDSSYLLDFVSGKCKRISYAASLGMKSIPEDLITVFKNSLSLFDSILVRENSTKKLISDMLEKPVYQVLDPVYLLSKEDWSAIAKVPKIKKPYILCFSIMAELPGMLGFCERIKQSTGFEIIRVSNPVLNFTTKAKTISTAGPLEFLGLILNAAYVVTNSFHGTAFAIIFEKPFYVFKYNDEKDIRLSEILKTLSLENRYVNSELNYENFNGNIDYESVHRILDVEKQKSVELLKIALTNYTTIC